MSLRFLKISFFSVFIIATKPVEAVYLIERKEIQRQIIQQLNEQNIIVLNGIAGIGKTTLALFLKERLKKKYDCVFWMNWDQSSIAEQLECVVKKLMNKSLKGKHFKCFSELVKALIGKKKVLFIVDNYNEKNTTLFLHSFKGLIRENVYFLITSRYKQNEWKNYEIPTLSEKESLCLMQRINKESSEQERRSVYQALGGYPYSLVRICQMINQKFTLTMERIVRMLKNSPNVLMAQETNRKEVQNLKGEEALIQGIKDLKKTDPLSYQALCFLGFLNGKTIPIELVHFFFKDVKKADACLEFLWNHSFISKPQKGNAFITFDIHDITKQLMKTILTKEEKDQVFKDSVSAFLSFYKTSFVSICETGQEDQMFYNHVLSFVDCFEKSPLHKIEMAPLFVMLLKRLLYAKRKPKEVSEALEDLETLYPETALKDPDILFEYYLEKGFVHCFFVTKDSFNKGIQAALKGLDLARSMNDMQKEIKALVRISWLYLYQGNIRESLKFIELSKKLIPSCADSYVRKEFYFATSWYYIDAGDFEAAYPYAQEGMAIDTKSKNPNIGLYIRLNKATCEYRFGRMEECIKTIEDAFERDVLVFSRGPSLVRAELLQLKGMALCASQKFKEALDNAFESLQIFHELLGEKKDYQPKAVSYKVIGDIYFEMNDLKNAEFYLEKGSQMFRVLTPTGGSFEFADALNALIKIYEKTEVHEKCQYLLHEIRDRFGENHEKFKDIFAYLIEKNKGWLMA